MCMCTCGCDIDMHLLKYMSGSQRTTLVSVFSFLLRRICVGLLFRLAGLRVILVFCLSLYHGCAWIIEASSLVLCGFWESKTQVLIVAHQVIYGAISPVLRTFYIYCPAWSHCCKKVSCLFVPFLPPSFCSQQLRFLFLYLLTLNIILMQCVLIIFFLLSSFPLLLYTPNFIACPLSLSLNKSNQTPKENKTKNTKTKQKEHTHTQNLFCIGLPGSVVHWHFLFGSMYQMLLG